ARLGHHPADGPAARLVLRARHLSADRHLHRLADRLAHRLALADDAALLARHPHLLADGVAGALHLLLDDRAGAVLRGARARVEHARARQPHALGHDRAGDVLGHRLAPAGAHLLRP